MGFRVSAISVGLSALAILILFTPTKAAIQCYEFTWPGETNVTDCDDYKVDGKGNDIPCKYPLVYTVPRHLPPDLDDLRDHCSKYPCPKYNCSVENQICLNWSWYDVNGNIYNYTTFCGTVADVTSIESTGAVPVSNGCWNERVGTFTRKVCACNSENYCNGAPAVVTSILLASVLSVAVCIFSTSIIL